MPCPRALNPFWVLTSPSSAGSARARYSLSSLYSRAILPPKASIFWCSPRLPRVFLEGGFQFHCLSALKSKCVSREATQRQPCFSFNARRCSRHTSSRARGFFRGVEAVRPFWASLARCFPLITRPLARSRRTILFPGSVSPAPNLSADDGVDFSQIGSYAPILEC